MSGATSTKLNRLWRLQQQVYGCRREGWGIGIVRELGMDMYTLLYLKWINKDLAQETLLNVMWQPGWEGSLEFSSVLNHVQLCDPMDCSMPGFPVHHQFLELAQTHVHWVSDAIQPSHPLSLPSPLPSILPSIKIFSIESVLHIRWPKDWSFSFSISPSNEYSGLISFRMDWLDLLQGRSPRDSQESSLTPQFKSINSSALSFLYSPTLTSIHDYWKNHSFDYMDLCWQNNVSDFNMLSRLVIAFLPRSKRLLISWLQSPSAVILELKKIKSLTVSIVSHLFAMKWWDWIPWSSFFESWVFNQLFHSHLSLSSRGYLVPLCFLP